MIFIQSLKSIIKLAARFIFAVCLHAWIKIQAGKHSRSQSFSGDTAKIRAAAKISSVRACANVYRVKKDGVEKGNANKRSNRRFNPLRPGIKLQILLLCLHTFLTEVVGRSCCKNQ